MGEQPQDKKGRAQPLPPKKLQTRTQLGHLLTIAEVADRLGVASKTIRRWCESGKLPATVKPYGKTTTYLISIQALVMLEAMEQDAAASRKAKVKVEKIPHASYLHPWVLAMENGLMTGRPFSKHTVTLYQDKVEGFLKRYVELDSQTLQSALSSIPAKQYAKKARLFEALVSFAKYLERQHVLEQDFLEMVKGLKPRRHLPPKQATVTQDGIDKLLDACESPLDRLLVTLLANTGLRSSEACALRWNDVNLQDAHLTVQVGKGGKARKVGLRAIVVEVLEQYQQQIPALHSNDYILSDRLGQQMERSGIQQRLERIGKTAGVYVSPHALRRAFVTINANKGRPLQMLQMACGHSKITTTMTYCRTSEQEVIEAMKGWD